MAALLGVAVLAGCTTTGDVTNPLTRKFTWFSFVNGDDIRRTCGTGAGDRVRLVYNGNYEEQVRVYEVDERGARPVVEAQVFGAVELNRAFSPTRLGDLFGGTRSIVEMGDAHAGALWQALERSGAFRPPPTGLRLHSENHWWSAVGCRDGRVFFQVWEVDGPSDQPPFVEMLRMFDETGVDWPPYRRAVVDIESPRERMESPRFWLEVGRNGFVL